MTCEPIISVVIPTYNRCDDLIYALNSARQQTFEDIEIIVVDDGSTDETENLMSEMCLEDHRITCWRLPCNSGSPAEPRNRGVDLAKGEYIAFLDSDDIWKNDKLEAQLRFMKRKRSLISYHDLFVEQDGYFVRYWSKMTNCSDGMLFKNLLKKNFIATSSVMIKRDTYNVFDKMDPKYDVAHDWDLWLKIAEYIPINYLPSCYGTLRLHSGSAITEAHKLRSECRDIVRKWKQSFDSFTYYKIMAYYYAVEVYDLLPKRLKRFIRS